MGDQDASRPFPSRFKGECAAPVCVAPGGKEFGAGTQIVLSNHRPYHPECYRRANAAPPAPAPGSGPQIVPVGVAIPYVGERWYKVEYEIQGTRVAISERFVADDPAPGPRKARLIVDTRELLAVAAESREIVR